ncbi:hypothetical protein ANCDUO_17894, partial [Ancylostoma duodenale]
RWDCELEKIANEHICSPDEIPPKYDVIIILDSNIISDIRVQTRTVLSKWANEAKEVDLSVDPKFDRFSNGAFGKMVYAKSTRFGCSMDYCDGRGMLMCVYDKKVNQHELLYEKALSHEEVCTACSGIYHCVNYLCSLW